MTVLRGVVAVAAAVWIAGCDGDVPAPIRHPPLDAIDPEAREQIVAARERLDEPSLAGAERGRRAGELGMLYHTYGMLLGAEDAYRQAESLAPDVAAWPYYLALVLRESGDLVAAHDCLGRALERDPGDVPTLLRLGQVALETGRQERAAEAYRRVLELDPGSAAALAGAGRVALARDDFAGAIERFEAALAIAPEASELNYGIGLAYRGLGDDRRALEWLERPHDVPVPLGDPREEALRGLRRGIVARQQRAASLAEQGGGDRVVEVLRQAVAADPDEARLRVNLAEALIRRQAYGEAEDALLAALERDPGYAVAHYNLGVVLAATGRREAAAGRYRQALTEDSGLLAARWNLALDLRRLGRFDEALAELRALVAADPARAEARLVEAWTLARLERWSVARDRLERAAGAFPDDDGLRQALVRVLAAAPVAAARDPRRAMEIADGLARPGMPGDVAEALAMAAAAVGDFATAVRLQRQLVTAADDRVPAVVREALTRNLRLYEQGRPCREPWPSGHPALDPS